MAQDFTSSVDCENLNVASSDALCLTRMKLQDPNRSQKAGGRRGQDADPRGLSDSFFPEAALHCTKVCFCFFLFLFRSREFAGEQSLCWPAFQRLLLTAVPLPPVSQLRRRGILCPVSSFTPFLHPAPWTFVCHSPSALIFLGFLAFSSSSCPGLGRQRTWGVLFLHVRPKENRGTLGLLQHP